MRNIEQMVADAMARFDALTSEQQADERLAQRKSWVVGEMMLEHPDMTRDEAERLFNQLV